MQGDSTGFQFDQPNLGQYIVELKNCFREVFDCVKHEKYTSLHPYHLPECKTRFHFIIQQIRGILDSYNRVNDSGNLQSFFKSLAAHTGHNEKLSAYESLLNRVEVQESYVKKFLFNMQIELNSLLSTLNRSRLFTFLQLDESFTIQTYQFVIEVNMSTRKITAMTPPDNVKQFDDLAESFFNLTRDVKDMEREIIEYMQQKILVHFLPPQTGIKDLPQNVFYHTPDGQKLIYQIRMKQDRCLTLWFVNKFILRNENLKNKELGKNLKTLILEKIPSKTLKKKEVLGQKNIDIFSYSQSPKSSNNINQDNVYVFFTKVNPEIDGDEFSSVVVRKIDVYDESKIDFVRCEFQRHIVFNELFRSCFANWSEKRVRGNEGHEKMKVEVVMQHPYVLYLIIFLEKKYDIVNLKLFVSKEMKILVKEMNNLINEETMEKAQKLINLKKDIPLLVHYLFVKLGQEV